MPAWPRVRASGFAHGLPVPLIEALRACSTSGGRIEMGPWVPDSAEPSPADLHLVAVDGRDAAARVLAALDDGAGRRLAVCIDTDAGTSLCAIAAGADGVLYLHDGSEELARALRAAASGMPALTATAVRALVAHARATCRAPADTAPGHAMHEMPATAIRLTAREREIIVLADQGCTFTQAARLLGVQVSTVYTHVRRLYEKLSVNSLPQALHEARRLGLL
ncbi:helix-turn-helix transcriptional regulator [Lysobacter brunescens]|uniref:Response regulator transcription factor n=1 Tax=Lysobacter brunescens TaxID=262323 RepID=A0ABW2YGE5_9GAMM